MHLRKRGYIQQATPSEQPTINYIIRGSHRGPFEISVPRQSVSMYSYHHHHHLHHHHHHHHHHHDYNLNKVCTMTRLRELTECLSFRSTFPAQVLNRFVFRKCYALTYTFQKVDAILKSYFSVGHEISNFYRNTNVRCWAVCLCQEPVNSCTHPRTIIRFSVIFPFLCYLSSSHKFIQFSPLRVCYIPCPSLPLWWIGGDGWRN